MEYVDLIKNVLIVLGGTVLLFLIFREFVTWYWKINKRINLHNRQIELLEAIYRQLGGESYKYEELDTEKIERMFKDGAITDAEYESWKRKNRKFKLF